MVKKLTLNFVILCALIFVTSSPVQAITINDAGAKNLKKTLSSYLQEQKDIVKAKGGELKTDGDILVEQGEKYYAATLPAITLKHGAGINVKFGLTAINAVPTDKNDSWKMSMAIPTPITITGKDNKNIGQINIAKQNMSGIWSTSLGGFSKLSAKYDDINFAPTDTTDDNITFNISNISINSNLEETKKNLWDGPSKVTMSDISIKDKKQSLDFNLGSINAKVDIKNYNHTAYKETFLNLNKVTDDKNATGFGNNILNLIKASGEGVVQISLNNIKVQNTSPNKANSTSIDKIELGGGSTFIKDKLNQTLSISYNGLDLGSNMQPLVPTQFKTAIALDKLPIEKLVSLGEQVISQNTDAPQTPQNIVQQMMGNAVQKLKEAGTSLMLKNTNLGNSNYTVNLNGILKAEPKSPLGGVGALNIETTGLNNIMTELQKTPKGSSMAQQLTMFRMISEENGDKNIAKIQLNKEGNVSINGKDMSALLGGGAPAQ